MARTILGESDANASQRSAASATGGTRPHASVRASNKAAWAASEIRGSDDEDDEEDKEDKEKEEEEEEDDAGAAGSTGTCGRARA
jgi:hypothetical protein